MRQFLSILLISFGFTFQTTNKDLEKDLNKDLLIVEYNAPFNLKNAYKGFDLLSGVSKNRVCIETSPEQRKVMAIKNVPTLILFLNNKEVSRWTAGLDMQIHTSIQDIQSEINKY